MSITNFLAQRNVTAAFPAMLPDNTVQVSAAAIIDNTTFGLYWNALSDATNRNWAGIACSANGHYITGVVTGGSIYYSNNYAVTMTASASAGTTAVNWSAVAMSASGQYQIATINSGSIYYSSNYGVTWAASATVGTTAVAWSAVALSASGTYATAVVNGGQIWYSTNYGQTWTAIPTSAGPSSITLAWSAIAISASGQYQVAVINGGSVYYSSTFGFSWTASTTPGTTAVAWTAVAISASGQYVTAGISGAALWTSTNYGQTWTVTSLTGFLWKAIVMVSSAQYQLAVGTSSMYYSNNFGSTWTTTGGTYTIRCLAASTAGHYLFAGVYGGVVYQSVVRVPSIFTSGSIILGNALSTSNQPQINYTQVGIGSTTNYASIGFASNANTLCWTANGNVGIGTTNPTSLFTVYSTGSATTTATLTITNSANSNNNYGAQILFTNITYNLGQISALRANNAADYSSYMAFYVNSSSNLFEAMRITSVGQVGIGKTNPAYTLDLANGSTVNLGNAVYTQYNSMGYTAASIAGAYAANGSISNSGGIYTFTKNSAGNDFLVSNIWPLNTMVQVSITASSPSSIYFVIYDGTGYQLYSSPILTSTFTTYTFTAKTQNNSTFFMHVDGGGAGTVFNWSAFSVNRLDTAMTGNVGIGATSPAYKLEVNGSFNAGSINTGSINSSGNVGINTTGPQEKLHIFQGNVLLGNRAGVGGSTQLSLEGGGSYGYQYLKIVNADYTYHGAQGHATSITAYNLLAYIAGVHNFYINGTYVGAVNSSGFVNASDKREKTNIKLINTAHSLERIIACVPTTFQRLIDSTDLTDLTDSTISDNIRNQSHIGLIAQDVMTINPHCISTWKNKSNEERYSVNYIDFITHLIGAVKEHNNMITTQANEITTLKSHISTLESTISTQLKTQQIQIEQLLSRLTVAGIA